MVYKLNQMIIDMLLGQEQTYLAINLANVNKADPEITKLPLEVLQNICLPGLPLLKLQLKVSTPVMLLQNLCPQEGLCNGLQMSIHRLGRFSI